MSRCIGVLLALLAGMPMWGLANRQDGGGEAEPLAEEEVVVVATRTERASHEVAATVSVRTAEDMEAELARDIADLVRFEPGVTVAGTGSRFGLTGFSIRGIGGNRVLTLVDGVRVPDEFSFGPFLSSRRDFVDIDSLDRAEIARGPTSPLYGSDALGGVVALRTKRPRDLLEPGQPIAGRVKGGYSGADDSVVGTLTLAGRAGPVSGLVLCTRRSGGETDNAGSVGGTGAQRERPDPQSIDVENLVAKLTWAPSESHELSLGADVYGTDVEAQVLSDYGSTAFGTTTNRRDADDSRSRRRWSLNYRWDADMAFADVAEATLYRQRSETEQFTFEDRTTPARAAQTRRRDAFFDQKVDGGWLQLGKAFSTGPVAHRVTYGLDYVATDSASSRDGGTLDASGAPVRERSPLPTRDFPLTEVEQLAFFAQDEISLFGGRLNLSPGVRFDRFEARAKADALYLNGNPGSPEPENYKDSEVTVKVGAVYALSDRLSVHGRYSEGFRAPPYDDVNVGFTNFLGGYKTIANPDLAAERSKGLEAGARLRGARGSLELAYFRNRYEDFIESFSLAPAFLRQRGVDPADGLLTFQSVNRGSVGIDGVELRGSYAFGAGFSARGALAYADGEDRQSGAPINSVEPLSAVVGLNYDSPGRRWGASLICTLVDAKDEGDIDAADPRLPTDGYGVLDLLAYAQLGPRARLNVGLFNLTDKRYLRWADTAGIGSDAPGRFTQPGFNAGATLRLEL